MSATPGKCRGKSPSAAAGARSGGRAAGRARGGGDGARCAQERCQALRRQQRHEPAAAGLCRAAAAGGRRGGEKGRGAGVARAGGLPEGIPGTEMLSAPAGAARMPQIAGAGPAAGTESGKHIATAQQMWHERAWTRALSAAGTALVRPANTAPSTSTRGKGSGTTPRQPFCRSAKPAFSPLPGAGDTHRWDREVTSAKMPSGRLEMSLPWRDLRRAGGPVIPAPPGPLRVTGGRGDSAGRRAGLGQALTAGAGSAAPRRPAAGCTAGSCSSGSCAREGGGHTARRAPREAAASCTPATPHPAPRHPQQLGHPFIQVEEEILVSPSTFGVP